jgi:glycosyltransferase involved in cell wall biosynthesis
VNSVEKQKYVNLLKIPPEKIDVAPVPVDGEFWGIEPSISEWKEFNFLYERRPGKITIGWCGRFVQVKNLPLLFEVFSLIRRKIPEAELLLAGDQLNSFFNLSELEMKFEIKPVYLGFIKGKEMLRCFYKSLDLYIHTSFFEGYGMVMAEALCSGIPVIATTTEGSKEIISNSEIGILTGFNAQEMAEGSLSILSNKERKNATGLNDKPSGMKYSYGNMLKLVCDSITKTLDKKTYSF